MQDEVPLFSVRILVEMVDPLGVEQRSATLDAMDFVALLQQELCEVGAILAGNTRNQCFFHKKGS